MPKKITTEHVGVDTSTLKLQAENKELHHQLDAALRSRILDESYEDFITKALKVSAKIVQPKWTLTPANSKKHTVMPVANFSDAHLDEVVRPEEIQMKNGYNRQIALKRLQFYTNNVCMVARDFIKGFEYPGITVNMLGDNFSGFIHDELRRTNADTLMGSMLFWVGPVVTMLETFAKEFGQVWVTGVVGNHGRHDKKPVMKMRAHENFDWLFMHMVRTVLEQKGEKRIQFEISNGQKLRFNIFDTRVITSHGDECKGGSGIAGMLSPQLIAFARMKKTYEFDQWWIGHWHHLSAYRGIRVNGCFPPEQEVLLADGTRKSISTVESGELVTTRTGVHKVKHVLPQQFDGHLVNLKCGTDMHQLRCTPNHEIYAFKAQETGALPTANGQAVAGAFCPSPRWIPAEYLSVGDYIQMSATQRHTHRDDVEWNTLTVDGRRYMRITHAWREEYHGNVFDLEIDTDHSYSVGGFTVHNSMKGYDEYASVMNFDFQVPLQDFFLIAPGHGTVASWPIHCMCPDEPWAEKIAKNAKAFSI